jgi:hypothetical protein
LIVRPTSEDVITGHLFQSLRALNPRWWLPDLLNLGLNHDRFGRQIFRQLRIELWQKQRRFPRYLLHWDEGKTEVDAVITWENPPTTVFIEMKYGSPLSTTTANNNGSQYPADQLIRNARIGLGECGWFSEPKLFDLPTRDFVLLLVSPNGKNLLVERYRDVSQLKRAIPGAEHLEQLPQTPFIGELSFRQIGDVLRSQRRWFSRPEQVVLDQLVDYISFKSRRIPKTE